MLSGPEETKEVNDETIFSECFTDLQDGWRWWDPSWAFVGASASNDQQYFGLGLPGLP